MSATRDRDPCIAGAARDAHALSRGTYDVAPRPARSRILRRRSTRSRLTLRFLELPSMNMTIVLWAVAAAVSLGLVAMCKTARMR
jgi:hypothetical protein